MNSLFRPSDTPPPLPRLWAVAAVVVVVFGVWLRSRGLGTIGLWADEADWAIRAATGTDTFIRPAGYMALARWLTTLQNDEFTLRLPSFLAAAVHLPVLWWVLRRSVQPAVAVLALWMFAVHPVAVGMAREFKPYAIEALLHTSLLALTMHALKSQKRRSLVGIAVLAPLSPLLSWSVVFAFPGVFLTALWQRFRHSRLADVGVLVLSAVVTLVVLGALFMARVGGADRKADYWGRKYDVFFTGHSVVDHVVWLARKTAGLAGQPGDITWPIASAVNVSTAVAGVACVVGVVQLVRRRRFSLLLLLLLPVVTTLVFNVLRQWPWGVFRTNFFLLPGFLVLAAIGVDAVLKLVPRRSLVVVDWLVLVAVIVALLCTPTEVRALRNKGGHSQTGQSDVRAAMTVLKSKTASQTAKEPLLLDGHGCSLFKYYRDFHVETSRTLGPAMREHLDDTCAKQGPKAWKRRMQALPNEPFWMLVAQRRLQKRTLSRLHAVCDLDVQRKFGTTLLVHCVPRNVPQELAPTPPAAGPPPAAEPGADAVKQPALPVEPATAPAAAPPPTAAPAAPQAPVSGAAAAGP